MNDKSYPPVGPSAPPGNPGYPPQQGYPPQGYPQQGYPQQGYPPQGYPPQGYPPHSGPQGHAPQPAAPTQGYTPQSPPQSTPQDIEQWDDDWAGSSFNEKSIRMAFIRKVYVIVIIQLLFTTGVTLFFCFHEPTKKWVQAHKWIYYISYGIFLVVYITLVCCSSCRRKWPRNAICLVIFTLALTYMTAMISSAHNTMAVLVALAITVGVSVAISLFACQTKWDFTKCGGVCLVIIVVLVMSGIILGVWYVFMRNQENMKILHAVFGCIGGLLASIALAIDTQMLIGNKKYKLSEEEYIFGALEIYLNITNVFQSVLCCLQLCSCC